MELRLVALGLLALASTTAASAQSLERGDRAFESTAGFSWHSPSGASLGAVSQRRVYLVGLRREWVIAKEGPYAMAYSAELIPLALIERTRGNWTHCRRTARGATCTYDTSARIAAGAGLSPIGLKLYLDKPGKARVYAQAAGGGLAFSSDVPVYDSRRANFTFEYGGGIELFTRGGRVVTVGYKFHHISNAGTADLNPGLDANILYVGVLRRRSR